MSTLLASCVPSLPPMSWLLSRSRDGWFLHHGKYVEVGNGFFFEGGWAGSWDAEGLLSASNVFGSGGIWSGDGIEIVTPSHTLECVYLLIQRDATVKAISNSLSFVIEFSEMNPMLDFRAPARFASVVLGLERYQKEIIRDGAMRVERLFVENCSWRPDGTITRKRKPDDPVVSRYEDYVDLLASVMKQTFDNCAHPQRTVRFEPLATCSRGYDSNASAALASRLGCTTAVTLKSARGGADDSGAPVGTALGLQVKEYGFDVNAFPGAWEREFFATGMGGEDMACKVFEPTLPRRILVTGFHGDRMWSAKAVTSDVLERGDVSGCSIAEYRLRLGFVHLSVPLIAARQHRAVREISNGEETAAFRVGGPYDRPIPRRILEQGGVARVTFGVTKKAVSRLVFRRFGQLSDASKRELRIFHSAALSSRDRLAYRWRAAAWWVRLVGFGWLLKVSNRIRYRAGDVHPAVRLGSWAGDWRLFEHGHPFGAVVLAWSIRGTRTRYRAVRAERDRGRAVSRVAPADRLRRDSSTAAAV